MNNRSKESINGSDKFQENIKIGTSGFSYKDWKGPFYPAALPAGKYLEYYSRHFHVLEINFTFYRMPVPNQLETMIERTAGQMSFIVKSNQQFTHVRDSVDSLRVFTESLSPFQQAGVLGGILFQFPYSFRNTPENWKYLETLNTQKGNHTGIVEFRHNSWIEDQTMTRLRNMGLSFCCVDQPDMNGLMGEYCNTTCEPGYLRFHGRNTGKWWEHEEAWERYDYSYTPEQIQTWVPRIRWMSDRVDRIYVFFNNHYQGQAVRNAQLLMAFLADLINSW